MFWEVAVASRTESENLVQTAVRVPRALLERIDRLAVAMSQPGLRVTRTDVLRLAATHGVGQLETEQRRRP
jgi:hypothetical protein